MRVLYVTQESLAFFPSQSIYGALLTVMNSNVLTSNSQDCPNSLEQRTALKNELMSKAGGQIGLVDLPKQNWIQTDRKILSMGIFLVSQLFSQVSYRKIEWPKATSRPDPYIFLLYPFSMPKEKTHFFLKFPVPLIWAIQWLLMMMTD